MIVWWVRLILIEKNGGFSAFDLEYEIIVLSFKRPFQKFVDALMIFSQLNPPFYFSFFHPIFFHTKHNSTWWSEKKNTTYCDMREKFEHFHFAFEFEMMRKTTKGKFIILGTTITSSLSILSIIKLGTKL